MKFKVYEGPHKVRRKIVAQFAYEEDARIWARSTANLMSIERFLILENEAKNVIGFWRGYIKDH